jgi:hypothetical protein
MQGLGREFDIACGLVPYDTNAGAGTGKRVSLQRAQALTFVLFKGAGVGTDVPVLTLQEHNAASGGTSQNLAKITTVYKKAAASLAGTEAWAVVVSQAAAATATLTGEATNQGIYAFDLDGTSLSDGFTHVSLSVADTGAAGAQLGAVLYLLHGRAVQRKPTNLAASL